jgi:hypothetical protein
VAAHHPIRTASRHYTGAVTESGRWRAYRPRDGDVVIATPSKCGTTWTQAMVSMLLAGTADLPAPLSRLSPWLDAEFPEALGRTRTSAQVLADLEDQTGPRCIKTHTPLDGVPIWEQVHYVAVFRNPADVFLSIRAHIGNMTIVGADHPLRQPLPEAFADWLAHDFEPDDCDRDTLASLASILRAAREAAAPARLLVLHYSDMRRDPGAALDRLAAHIGRVPSAALRAAILAATTRGAMRDRAADYAPEAGTGLWHREAGFFDRVETAGNAQVLTAEDIAAMAARLAEMLAEPDRSWLLHGNGAEAPGRA